MLENQAGKSRIAVVTGRALGKAVKRNRAKRLIRAALHNYIDDIQPGWDIILIARQPFLLADLPAAKKSLEFLLERANLLIESDDHA